MLHGDVILVTKATPPRLHAVPAAEQNWNVLQLTTCFVQLLVASVYVCFAKGVLTSGIVMLLNIIEKCLMKQDLYEWTCPMPTIEEGEATLYQVT